MFDSIVNGVIDSDGTIASPTLIVLGTIAGGLAHAELLALIPHARLALLAFAGHNVSLEAPLDTAQLIAEFCDATPRADHMGRSLPLG